MANYYPGKSINPIVIIDYIRDITINHSCERQQNHENIGCSASILPIPRYYPRASNVIAASGMKVKKSIEKRYRAFSSPATASRQYHRPSFLSPP